MKKILTRRVTLRRMAGVVAVATLMILMGAGCDRSGSERADRVPERQSAAAQSRTVRNVTAQPDEPPAWVAAMDAWPDTCTWVLDSMLETRHDGFVMRLRPELFQDFSRLGYPDIDPLIFRVLMTLRPVPTWPSVKGLNIDSVALFDAASQRRITVLQLLSHERRYEDQTVRTFFITNLAKPVAPELTEGQLIKPVYYVRWDDRRIRVEGVPLPVRFTKEATTLPDIRQTTDPIEPDRPYGG